MVNPPQKPVIRKGESHVLSSIFLLQTVYKSPIHTQPNKLMQSVAHGKGLQTSKEMSFVKLQRHTEPKAPPNETQSIVFIII